MATLTVDYLIERIDGLVDKLGHADATAFINMFVDEANLPKDQVDVVLEHLRAIGYSICNEPGLYVSRKQFEGTALDRGITAVPVALIDPDNIIDIGTIEAAVMMRK